MTDNIFVYYGDATISRKEKNYKVELEEECIIYVKRDTVERVLKHCQNRDENLIALILAKMEYARKCRNADFSKKEKKLDEDIVVDGLAILLLNFSEEVIIEVFSSAKWHEIAEIVKSESPVEIINRYI